MLPDRFGGTNPSPVDAGKDLTIAFENPNLANQTVTIDISNGDGATTSVTIELDAAGKGSKKWTVPAIGWDGVLLSHPTSADHAVPVK